MLCLPIAAAVLAVPSGVSASTRLARTAQPNLRVTVFVYNYAEVGDRILSQAEAEASRIFASAGIDTAWLRSPLNEHEDDPEGVRRRRLGPSDLFLRIHARSANLPRPESRYSLGYALIQKGQPAPRIAGVLFEKVEELLRSSRNSFDRDRTRTPASADRYMAVLLGHVIAHEIGHLLLGTNEHARSGLMQAGWDARARAFAMARRLHFTDAESRKIREEVRRRFELPGSEPLTDKPRTE